MKPNLATLRKYLFVVFGGRLNSKGGSYFSSKKGFTLIELLVAALLTSVVILIAWSGLINVLSMSQAAEARTARQTELNRALDFMTNEIRMARSINQTATKTANGSSVTVADVVTSSGLDLNALGNHGEIGLYLERPTSANIPTTCPSGGPNAGLTPPSPADYDRVVYDVRSSPSGWLGPRILTRYGRVPNEDGTIDPCKSPISSDPMADALASTQSQPACPGVLSGGSGFYSCVNGKQVDLHFQSNISNLEAQQVSSSVSSRLEQVYEVPPQSPTGTLTLTVSASLLRADFSWSWTGNPPPDVSSYQVHKRSWFGTETVIYSGTNTSFSNLFIVRDCFWVTANTSSGVVQSNQSCL